MQDNNQRAETGQKIETVCVDTRKLSRVGARPDFLDYLVQIWNYRHFIMYDARARVRTGNIRDRLGSAWLILQPLMNGLTFYLIFGLLLRTSNGIDNFIGYLVIGIFLFQFSSATITQGARAITSNGNVIRAFNFPRATLPIAINIRELLANVPVVLTMFILILLFPPVEDVTWRWVLVIPVVVLQSIFNLGVTLIVARLVAIANDITYFISFAMRLWLYASAVFFSYERFITHPEILAIIKINPLFNVLDIVRDSVLYGRDPAWQSWALLTLWALGAIAVGLIFFWRGEETYGRE